MTKDIKKLTVTELKKQSKALDEQREFTVSIGGQDYKLTHDVVFRKTKQHKVLDDVIAFFSEGTNVEALEMTTPYTALLIIKHFTSLEVSDNIDEALALLEVLIDLEAFDKILNELPVDEVTKVQELLVRTVENMKQNLEMAEEETEGLLEQIENEKVKGLIQ